MKQQTADGFCVLLFPVYVNDASAENIIKYDAPELAHNSRLISAAWMAGSRAGGSPDTASQDRSSISAESGTSSASSGRLRHSVHDAKQPKTHKQTASGKTKHAPRHSAEVQTDIAQVSKTDQDPGAHPAEHEPLGFRKALDSHQAAPSRVAGPVISLQGPSRSHAATPSSSDSIRPTQRHRSGKAEHLKAESAQQAQMPGATGPGASGQQASRQQASQQQGSRSPQSLAASSSSNDSIRPRQRRRSGKAERPDGDHSQEAQPQAATEQQAFRQQGLPQSPAASSSSSEPLQHVLRHRRSLPQASQPHAAMPSVSSPAPANQAEPEGSGPLLADEAPTPADRMLRADLKPGASMDVKHGSSAPEGQPSDQSPLALIQEEALVPEQMTNRDPDVAQAPPRRQPRELQGLMPFAWDKYDCASTAAPCVSVPNMLAVITCLRLHAVKLLSMSFKEPLQRVGSNMRAPALPAACLSGPHC